MPTYRTPGVYREERAPLGPARLEVGVPVFLGYAASRTSGEAVRLTAWTGFPERFGAPLEDGFLAAAVRGFFGNGGEICHVVALDPALPPEEALEEGLEAVALLEEADLVCAPDLMRELARLRPPGRLATGSTGLDAPQAAVLRMQTLLLRRCDSLGDRMAILDSFPGAGAAELIALQREALHGYNGALYYPWIRVAEGPGATGGFVPPCGHVAGVYARTDRRVGVHKAPANERLEGVLDLEFSLTDRAQEPLNAGGVNALRAFPGRGIRVWGARTLAPEDDPAWRYVSVRRLFLTAGRWIERNMTDVAFEPQDMRLWSRISRELTTYFTGLFRQGALRGTTPEEAFYVKCDAHTNPPEVREAGLVVTEIGLAPALPNEFVIVRLVHGADGITIAGPTTPG